MNSLCIMSCSLNAMYGDVAVSQWSYVYILLYIKYQIITKYIITY